MSVVEAAPTVARPSGRGRHLQPVGIVLLLALLGGFLAWRFAVPAHSAYEEYRSVVPGDIPAALALGSDGAVWFTIENASALGVLRDGTLQRVSKGGENLEPLGLAVAPDGSVWFTDAVAEAIGHRTTDGQIERFVLPTRVTQFGRLAVATDGSVWAADSWSNSLVRLKDGELTAFAASSAGAAPFGVAADPHGGIWATWQSANRIVHVDPDGHMTELEPPTRSAGPSDIAVDQAGVVWFVELRAGKLGRYAEGRFAEFSLPQPQAGVTDLAVGQDGSVWFTQLRSRALGRLREGEVMEFRLPRSDARPFGVRVDGVGRVWYTDLTGWVGNIPAAEARRSEFDLRRWFPWPRA